MAHFRKVELFDNTGFSEDDIDKMELLYGQPLPARYKSFLSFAGKRPHMFDERFIPQPLGYTLENIAELQVKFNTIFEASDVNTVPGKKWCFLNGGREYYFFTGSSDNPEIWQFTDAEIDLEPEPRATPIIQNGSLMTPIQRLTKFINYQTDRKYGITRIQKLVEFIKSIIGFLLLPVTIVILLFNGLTILAFRKNKS